MNEPRGRTIYKYAIEVGDEVKLALPTSARIIAGAAVPGSRGRGINLWAIVDLDAPVAFRQIAIRGTGHPLEDELDERTHVATVMATPFIWHVFDRSLAADRLPRRERATGPGHRVPPE